MGDPINESGRKVIELAYSESAESFFVRHVGIVLQAVGETPAEKALAARILSRLTDATVLPEFSEPELDRLQTMRNLLLVTFEHRENPSRYQDDQVFGDETKH